MRYDELEKLPADAYLDPSRFVTDWDKDPYKKEECYQRGLRAVVDYTDVTIGARSIWFANTPMGGHVTSYEGIGYHAYTADLLRGWLESGVRLFVVRSTDDGPKRYELIRDGGLFGTGYAEEVEYY